MLTSCKRTTVLPRWTPKADFCKEEQPFMSKVKRNFPVSPDHYAGRRRKGKIFVSMK